MPALNRNKCYLLESPVKGVDQKDLPALSLDEISNLFIKILAESCPLNTKNKDGQLELTEKLTFHTNKKEVFEALQAIANLLQADNQTLTEDKKYAMAMKATDDLYACTPGFHNRLLQILISQGTPKNMGDLLSLMRRDIVDTVAYENINIDSEGYRVHTHNFFFTVAARYGYGVLPINPDDPYTSLKLTAEQIHAKLQVAFDTQYDCFFQMLSGLEMQIRSALASPGYSGKKTGAIKDKGEADDYKSGQYEQFITFFNSIFAPEKMSMDDVFILNDDYQILDINWLFIRMKLYEKLKNDNYIDFNKHEAMLVDCLFGREPTLENFKKILADNNTNNFDLLDSVDTLNQWLTDIEHWSLDKKLELVRIYLKKSQEKKWGKLYRCYDDLPKKFRIEWISKDLLLKLANSPASIPVLLEAIKDIDQRDRGVILGQVDNKGQSIIMLAVRHSPESIPALIGLVDFYYCLPRLINIADTVNTMLAEHNSTAFSILAAIKNIDNAYREMIFRQIAFDMINKFEKHNSTASSILATIKNIDKSDKAMIFIQVDQYGRNVIMSAANNSSVYMLALFEAVKDLEKPDRAAIFNHIDKYGRNAMMTTALNVPASIPTLLETIKDLNVSDKATIFKQVDNDGRNILMLAVKRCSSVSMTALFEAIKDLDVSDSVTIFLQMNDGDPTKRLTKYLSENYPAGKQLQEVMDKINFDQHLSELQAKIKQFEKNIMSESHRDAYQSAKTLVSELTQAKVAFFLSEESDIDIRASALVKASLNALTAHKAELNKHRGFTATITKFILILATLPLTFPVAIPLYCTGYFKSNTGKKIDSMESDLKKNNPQSGG